MNGAEHVDAASQAGHRASSSFKEKAREEFRLFWVIALYLALMLSAFAWYRRLILSGAGLSYIHYGEAVIEALILAKVILIGQALGLGRRFEGLRLILSVLLKALVFGVFIATFSMLEHVVEGLVHHESWAQIAHRVVSAGRAEILARSVMIIVALIPFFAFWETDRALGNHKLFALFFQKQAA